MNRVIFLFDGFNVYHALDSNKKYHKYKWLDYFSLAKCFVSSKDKIVDVYYFTAYAFWSPPKVSRHKILIRALRLKNVNIVFGKYKIRDKKCRLCNRKYKIPEEKQTDVNIAVKLFQLAITDECDTIILVTADSDLVPVVKAVKETFPSMEIGLITPIGRGSKELKDVCDFRMKMKEKHLLTSRFPDAILIDPSKNKYLHCPSSWK